MYTALTMAAVSGAPPGQPWRLLVIFGVVAVLMGLVAVAQMTGRRAATEDVADEPAVSEEGPSDSGPALDGDTGPGPGEQR